MATGLSTVGAVAAATAATAAAGTAVVHFALWDNNLLSLSLPTCSLFIELLKSLVPRYIELKLAHDNLLK